MKKLLWSTQFFFFICFNFFLLLTVYQFTQSNSEMSRLRFQASVYDQAEDFDPHLTRLNTVKKLTSYCDSSFEEKFFAGTDEDFEKVYAEVALNVVRKRFYHGYSVYGFNNNYMAMFAENVSVEGLSAIVIPDDILDYPYAACSQQSIVLMEILKAKNIKTRKVGFKGKQGGHFCFEVYYAGAWHFFDPDMEPDDALLASHNRPGIAYLTKHPDLLKAAYKQYPVSKVDDLFANYWYGKPDTFSAPKARIFQYVTKFLSYTLWSFFLLAFVYTRRKYKQYGAVKASLERRPSLAGLVPGLPAYQTI